MKIHKRHGIYITPHRNLCVNDLGKISDKINKMLRKKKKKTVEFTSISLDHSSELFHVEKSNFMVQ